MLPFATRVFGQHLDYPPSQISASPGDTAGSTSSPTIVFQHSQLYWPGKIRSGGTIQASAAWSNLSYGPSLVIDIDVIRHDLMPSAAHEAIWSYSWAVLVVQAPSSPAFTRVWAFCRAL